MGESKPATGGSNGRSRSMAERERDLALARLEEFAHILSHDVTATSRGIRQLCQCIDEDLLFSGAELPGDIPRYLAMLSVQAARMDRYFDDLLTYSRIGRLQDNNPVFLDDVCTAAVRQLTVPKFYQLRFDVQRLSVSIGAKDLRRVFASLIGNAVKHRDTHGKCALVTGKQDGDMFEIAVADDGPGIPLKYQANIWKPMTVLKPRDHVEGSGMGLAIVARVAEHYGGFTSIGEGLDGKGQRVAITLPIAPDATSHSQAPRHELLDLDLVGEQNF